MANSNWWLHSIPPAPKKAPPTIAEQLDDIVRSRVGEIISLFWPNHERGGVRPDSDKVFELFEIERAKLLQQIKLKNHDAKGL